VTRAVGIVEITIVGGHLEGNIPHDPGRYCNQVEFITAWLLRQAGFVDVTQSQQMLEPLAVCGPAPR
jgi:hypothetical protein